MKRKLKRSRRSVFGRQGMPTALKATLWVAACLAVIALGYFGAMLVSQGGLPKPDVTADTPSSGGSNSGSASTEDAEDPQEPTPVLPDTQDSLRAFYLPHAALTAEDLPATLSDAREAGFTAVLFDLKDAEGNLYYRFTAPQAKRVNSYTADAFTQESLTALFDVVRECGLVPIPRLFAFCDDKAAAVLTDARVQLTGNHTWAWYDDNPDDGGKKWLNPYTDAAQGYVRTLATELKELGAAAIMLDGVQFPTTLDKNAYLGELAVPGSEADALAAFVAGTRTLLGEDCPLLLACTAKGALGTATKEYGGNPLTFGSTLASPLLTTEIQAAVEKMILRTQGPDIADTAIAPLLNIADLTATQTNAAMADCVSGGAHSFILYATDGDYDFAAYDLP